MTAGTRTIVQINWRKVSHTAETRYKLIPENVFPDGWLEDAARTGKACIAFHGAGLQGAGAPERKTPQGGHMAFPAAVTMRFWAYLRPLGSRFSCMASSLGVAEFTPSAGTSALAVQAMALSMSLRKASFCQFLWK
jgi:hypothetical protein